MTASDTTWACLDCGAAVDPHFELCWQCGTLRDGSRAIPDEDPVPAGDDEAVGPLVTVATYGDPEAANLARIRLESEGVPAMLADEFAVGTAGLIGALTGGVKVQVGRLDVELATVILLDRPDVGTPADGTGSDRSDPVFDATDELVGRALRSAFFGLLLFPFHLYSIWLIGRIALAGRPLNTAQRTRVAMACVCNVPMLVVYALVIASTL
ncbi:MAG: hypothetical protein CMJ18_03245 [Phycisphaeraceae bacterium]|nr:hypothetical protein [Phycisphaeraceae bacterium]